MTLKPQERYKMLWGLEGARNYKLLRGIRVDFVEEVIFLDDL